MKSRNPEIVYKYQGVSLGLGSSRRNPIVLYAKYREGRCLVIFYRDGKVEIDDYCPPRNMDDSKRKKILEIATKYRGNIKKRWEYFHGR
jgi:hypothetical protein